MTERLFFGCSPLRGHIDGALVRVREQLEDADLAIIRSIDSSCDSAGIASILDRVGVQYFHCDGCVGVSVADLWSLVDRQIFTGFDEVWIVRGHGPLSVISAAPHATGPAEFLDSLPPGLEAAMRSSNSVLIVADGTGLNYVTTDQRIAAAIEELLA